jgi:very-short-patch-repair endonuclease
LTRQEWSLRFGCLVVAEQPMGDDWTDAAALSLRFGSATVITGPTALRIRRIPIPHRIVMAVVDSEHTRLPGALLMRDGAPRSIGRTLHFTFAQPADALVDTLRVLPNASAKELLDLALQRHWISVNRFSEIIECRRTPGRAGIRQLETLYRWAQSGTRSEAERRMLPLLRRVPGVRWRANYPILLNGQVVAEADFAVPELKLCIEIDGRAYHSDRAAFENDRTRQNALVLAGWTVLRFTWEQITAQPDEVVRQVLLAVKARGLGRIAG